MVLLLVGKLRYLWMRRSFITISFLLFNFCFNLQAKETIVLASPVGSVAKVSAGVLSYAYEKIGIPLEIIELPSERALLWSNSGYYDGEVMRIEAVGKLYPNLIRVPVVIDKIEAMVFTKRKDIVIENWDSLRPYSILLQIGSKYAEIGTKGMNTKSFASSEEVFDALDKDLYDIAIATRLTGMVEVNRLNSNDIHFVEPPLTEYNLYHYLNKKHHSLIPQITQMLKKMEKSGMIEKIRRNILQEQSTMRSN